MEEDNLVAPKRKYLLLLILLILIIVVALFFYVNKFWQKKNQPNEAAGAKEAVLSLEYGQKQRWFSGEVTEGMTFLNVLETASIAGNFKLEASSTIVSLDGFFNDGQKKWTCYLNGELIKDPLSKKIIHAQDKISCQYK